MRVKEVLIPKINIVRRACFMVMRSSATRTSTHLLPELLRTVESADLMELASAVHWHKFCCLLHVSSFDDVSPVGHSHPNVSGSCKNGDVQLHASGHTSANLLVVCSLSTVNHPSLATGSGLAIGQELRGHAPQRFTLFDAVCRHEYRPCHSCKWMRVGPDTVLRAKTLYVVWWSGMDSMTSCLKPLVKWSSASQHFPGNSHYGR